MHNAIVGVYKPGGTLLSGQFANATQGNFQTAGLETPKEPLTDIVAVLASGSRDKLRDARRVLRFYELPVFSVSDLFGSVEDSQEKEPCTVDICKGKATVSFDQPWDELTPDEQAESLKVIGAKSPQHVIKVSEDRHMNLDVRYRDHEIFDSYRNHADPLVREAFKPGHPFPGKRLKELTSAVGGNIHFLDMLKIVEHDFKEQGIEIAETHEAYITYYFQPLKPGIIPLPEDGIYAVIKEPNRKFREVTAVDRQRERQGHQFEMDDFDVPSDYIETLDNEAPSTVEALKTDRESDYHERRSPAAKGLRILIEGLNIQRLERPREYSPVKREGAPMMSNVNIGHFSRHVPEKDPIDGFVCVPGQFPIYNMLDLENLAAKAEGTVIENDRDNVPEGVDPEIYRLERDLIVLKLFADRATVKPLGDQLSAGRPIMVDRTVREAVLPFYYDFANLKTVGDKPADVFKLYETEGELADQALWDPTTFTPNPESADSDLFSSEDLWSLEEFLNQSGLREEDLGFCWSALGSASSYLEAGNRDALDYVRMAAESGLTAFHGGGSRCVMRRFFEGYLQELKSNPQADFLNFGIRTPIASRKEGSLHPLLDEFGYDLDGGDFSDPYYTFGDGRFHVATVPNIGIREHLIQGPGHAGTYFVGGIGWTREFVNNAYHNLMVHERGYGVFPGMRNDQTKPIFIVNSQMQTGNEPRGFFDVFKKNFNGDRQDMLDMRFFDTPQEAFNAKIAYARSLGFDIPKPGAKRIFMPGAEPA